MIQCEPDEWNAAALAMASRQAELESDRPSVLRQTLAELDQLMRAAPGPVQGAYGLISETELGSDVEHHAETITEGGLEWLPFRSEDDNPALYSLAVQIRTIDHLLAHRIGYNAAFEDGSEYRTPDGAFYVVPAAARRDYRQVDGRLGSTYDRRGMLKHRVIRSAVNGVTVRLVSSGTLDTAEPRKLRLGAALTPELVLETTTEQSRFAVRNATSVKWPDILRQQVDSAHADDVDVALWPELAVSKTGAADIVALLQRRRGRPSSRLQIVLPGSYHEPLPDGRVENLAQVYTGKGRLIDVHRKMVPFESRTLGVENLKPGSSVLVILCDGFVASTAICKDFCDIGVTLPWDELDVDLVLVPSMGDHGAMLAHLDKARSLRIRRNVRAFVVQQFFPRNADDPLGLVLPAPRDPPRTVVALEQSMPWSSYEMG